MSVDEISQKAGLKALQESADKNRKFYERFSEGPDSRVLEAIYLPEKAENCLVVLRVKEFSSVCPKTGQPDYGFLIIRYVPKFKLVETKSLKLYLGGYREYGIFGERIAIKVAQDLFNLLEPVFIQVVLRATSRGGIEVGASSLLLDKNANLQELKTRLNLHDFPVVEVN